MMRRGAFGTTATWSWCLLLVVLVASVQSLPDLSASSEGDASARVPRSRRSLMPRAPQGQPSTELALQDGGVRIQGWENTEQAETPSQPAVVTPKTPQIAPVKANTQQGKAGTKQAQVSPGADPKPDQTPATEPGSSRGPSRSASERGQFPANLRRQCTPGRYTGTASGASKPPPSRADKGGKARTEVALRPKILRRQGAATCPAWLKTTPSRISWRNMHTTPWLRDWWQKRSPAFGTRAGGMVSVLRQEFLGDPASTCKLTSAEDCDFSPCGEPALLGSSVCDQQPAYHVLLAVRNLKTYFQGYLHALEVAVLNAALTKDRAALTFFPNPGNQDYTQFKAIATVVNALIGLLGPSAPLIKGVFPRLKPPDALFFLPPHVLANIQVLALSAVAPTPNDTPRVAADLGEYVRNMFKRIMDTFTVGYDRLMKGLDFGETDFVEWVQEGNFADFPGFDEHLLVDLMTRQINARIVNALWRVMRVMILGGMPCGSDPGLGTGPEEGYHCVDGRSWFLLYLAPDDTGYDIMSTRRWGWTAAPPGLFELGKGPYQGISHKDVIVSSVNAWKVAQGNKYNLEFANRRFLDSLGNPGGRIAADGARWEGTFTIPVCDISQATDLDYADRILQPYNRDSQVRWCGPICSNSWDVTKEFYNAAHVWGYAPIIRGCGMEPPWGRKNVPLSKKLNMNWWLGNPANEAVTSFGPFNKKSPFEY